MIVAERKAMDVLEEMLSPYQKIALVGCKGCVTVCNAGGQKEVGILSTPAQTRQTAGEKADRNRRGDDRAAMRPGVHRDARTASGGGRGRDVDGLRRRGAVRRRTLQGLAGFSRTEHHLHGRRDRGGRIHRTLPSLRGVQAAHSPAASAPSPAVPKACSTAPAAVRWTATARSTRTSNAAGNGLSTG